MLSRYMNGILFKHTNSKPNLYVTVKNVHFFPQHCTSKMQGRFKWCSRKMSMWLREQSIQVVRSCTKQFKFIAAQRIRRSIQNFHLYTRIWDEIALKQFVRSWRHRMTKNIKDFIVGAVGVSAFNWEQDKITDKEMYSHSKEIDQIHRLRDSTVVCSECHQRIVIDTYQPGIEYCKCHQVKSTNNKVVDDWEPFIERRDMLVWKKKEQNTGGLYSYKIYGSFDDVSAEDFLQVQIDINYRREWDETAQHLEIIETDPSSKHPQESSSDIIYWEMLWPRLFANREYVYQRRWLYDRDEGVVIIVSKGVDHPNAPQRPGTFRVTKYWSCIVIKPHTNFHEPGIEFGLTYFDDSGVNLPTAITSWIAMSGLPNYLCSMREASKKYKSYKASHKSESAITKSFITIQDDKNSTYVNNNENDNINDNKNSNNNSEMKKDIENKQLLQSTSNVDSNSTDEDKENEQGNSDSDSTQEEEDQGVLDYFFLAKLFA